MRSSRRTNLQIWRRPAAREPGRSRINGIQRNRNQPASRRLGVTQPAISKMLKNLKDSAGFVLFKRQGGQPSGFERPALIRRSLSGLSRHFIEQLREIVDEISGVSDFIKPLSPGSPASTLPAR
jgi:hypothetical protein